MKDWYPLEVAEYAVANKIIEEHAFYWWEKIAIKRRNRMINVVKYRYWSCTHNFSLEIPHSWEEAIAIDRKTVTEYWRRKIEK